MRDSRRSEHLDEGMAHEWLDGALSPSESERVAAHVASCGACAAMVAEARGLIAGSSRILASLDDVPSGVVPSARPADDEATTARSHDVVGGAAPKRVPDVGLTVDDAAVAATRGAPATSPVRRRAAPAWRWLRDPRTAVAAGLLLVAAGVTSSGLRRSNASMVASAALDRIAPVVVWAAVPPGREVATMTAAVDSAMVVASAPAAAPAPAPVPAAPSRATAVRSFASASRVADAATAGAAIVTPPSAPSMMAERVASADATAPRPTVPAREDSARAAVLALGQTMARSEARRDLVGGRAAKSAAAPAASAGQGYVRGLVVEQGTAQPIGGVQVRVAGSAVAAMTDSAGRFVLPAAADSVRVQARRIGYQSRDTTLRVAGAGELPVTVTLDPATTMLESVTVNRLEAAVVPGPCYAVRRGRGAPTLPKRLTLGESAGAGATAATRTPLAGDSVLVRVGAAELRLSADGARLRGVATDSSGARGRVELRRTSCPTK